MQRITDLCICIYVFGCKLSLARLCDSEYGITPADDITIIIIIIIIIIITTIISFMQGIYTYIPYTNCVPRQYSVAAFLLLLFMVLISLVSVLNLLYFYISTFRSMCAVPNMAVFCSSLTSCFPGMLLTYFLLLLLLLETFAVYLLLPAWNITYLLYNKVEFSL